MNSDEASGARAQRRCAKGCIQRACPLLIINELPLTVQSSPDGHLDARKSAVINE